jgi:hypothetical protein
MTDILQDDPLLSDQQIADIMTRASGRRTTTATIRRERRHGNMPPIVRLTPRRHGTRKSRFVQWLREREQSHQK